MEPTVNFSESEVVSWFENEMLCLWPSLLTSAEPSQTGGHSGNELQSPGSQVQVITTWHQPPVCLNTGREYERLVG